MQDSINTASLVPFQYGQHDCALFAAYVVDQMCDSDHARRLRAIYVYRDEAGATDIIEQGGGLLKLAKDWLGEPIPISRAMPGDVALVRNNGTVLLAIVEGHQVVAAGATGVIPLPLSECACAWRVE
jgi:hypothetical protein